MILLGCCTMNAAVKKVALRVLYVGGSPEFDTIGDRDADSTEVAKSAQERTASFDAYLRQYFTIVKSIHAKDYTPEMSKHYDVTIIDGTPKPIEIKKYTINTKWGEREMQDKIFDFYLRSNRIEEGRKSYSSVIGLLISYEDNKKI